MWSFHVASKRRTLLDRNQPADPHPAFSINYHDNVSFSIHVAHLQRMCERGDLDNREGAPQSWHTWNRMVARQAIHIIAAWHLSVAVRFRKWSHTVASDLTGVELERSFFVRFIERRCHLPHRSSSWISYPCGVVSSPRSVSLSLVIPPFIYEPRDLSIEKSPLPACSHSWICVRPTQVNMMLTSASQMTPMSGNAAESSGFPDSTVSAEERCLYRSKPCANKRVIKVNGEMHKLCGYHRKRANINQQRVHLRRRLSKKQAQQLELKYGPMSGDEEAIEFEPSTAPCGDLTYTELQILKLLLSDDPADVELITSVQYHSPTVHLSV